MSNDIIIPPEALEAAAKARYEKWAEQTRADEQFDGYAIELLCPPWSDINEDYRAELMEQERAACLAMLRNWPGKHVTDHYAGDLDNNPSHREITLPLTTEKQNAET